MACCLSIRQRYNLNWSEAKIGEAKESHHNLKLKFIDLYALQAY